MYWFREELKFVVCFSRDRLVYVNRMWLYVWGM